MGGPEEGTSLDLSGRVLAEQAPVKARAGADARGSSGAVRRLRRRNAHSVARGQYIFQEDRMLRAPDSESVFLAGDAVQLMRDALLPALVGVGTGSLREHYEKTWQAHLPRPEALRIRSWQESSTSSAIPICSFAWRSSTTALSTIEIDGNRRRASRRIGSPSRCTYEPRRRLIPWCRSR